MLITDLNGRLVEEQRNIGTGAVQRHIDLSGEPKGVYVVRITVGDEVLMRRLVIQ